MTSGPHTAEQPTLNKDVPWDSFDPGAYIGNNYLDMKTVDEEIVSRVRDHFSGRLRGSDRVLSGIDVGAGPNLYPSLAMLPWCENITLLEWSANNIRYLEGQRPDYDGHWEQFWKVLREDREYRGFDSRAFFRKAAVPVQGSLFDLCRADTRWDIGTMFFVAESITESLDEFRRGVGCFMHVLKPGAPFAAAFMEHSEGYRVGDLEFPATYDIDLAEVCAALEGFAHLDDVHRMADVGHLVRHGHTGMILVCGRRKE
ncbi:SCO2525 family SAM-dependent methyltransferase [Streptomyces galbus]|uniref:SCO2525 family SAM-dependent methyltransferase n=1 Tax=Streptomyces galbus TaxID=33898 RepID=UPI0037B6E9D6